MTRNRFAGSYIALILKALRPPQQSEAAQRLLFTQLVGELALDPERMVQRCLCVVPVAAPEEHVHPRVSLAKTLRTRHDHPQVS